jgi:DNA-binding XRE family transcriptional regulator
MACRECHWRVEHHPRCSKRTTPANLTPEQAIYRHIGDAIQERRCRLGMTQEKLAKRLSISRASLANMEAGRQQILIHRLYEIAEALTCPPGDLAPKPKISGRDYLNLSAGSTARRPPTFVN